MAEHVARTTGERNAHKGLVGKPLKGRQHLGALRTDRMTLKRIFKQLCCKLEDWINVVRKNPVADFGEPSGSQRSGNSNLIFCVSRCVTGRQHILNQIDSLNLYLVSS